MRTRPTGRVLRIFKPNSESPMTKHVYPEFHKALMERSAYPAASRKIKCEETRRSYLYRTGEHVYKIRKTSTLYSTPAIKERYAHIALELGRRWAGEAVQAVVPIVCREGAFALGGAGEPVDYALRMVQLPDGYWLHRLLAAGKVTPTLIGRLARFMAEQHAAGALDERAAEAGRPEHVQALLDDITYQTRKYEGVTVGEPMLDMIGRPLHRYLDDERRLLVRRVKRGHIVEGHGALVPEHIYVRGADIHALAPLEAQAKFRVLDAANDVALLVNDLVLREEGEAADLLLKRYVAASRDRDLPRTLPVYRILQALRFGLLRSEWMSEQPPDSPERAALAKQAATFYNLALQTARALPKPG